MDISFYTCKNCGDSGTINIGWLMHDNTNYTVLVCDQGHWLNIDTRKREPVISARDWSYYCTRTDWRPEPVPGLEVCPECGSQMKRIYERNMDLRDLRCRKCGGELDVVPLLLAD